MGRRTPSSYWASTNLTTTIVARAVNNGGAGNTEIAEIRREGRGLHGWSVQTCRRDAPILPGKPPCQALVSDGLPRLASLVVTTGCPFFMRKGKAFRACAVSYNRQQRHHFR